MDKKQKETVDKFVEATSIMVTWCYGCKYWTLHCPVCGSNNCGSGCDCGCGELLKKQQTKLDILLETGA